MNAPIRTAVIVSSLVSLIPGMAVFCDGLFYSNSGLFDISEMLEWLCASLLISFLFEAFIFAPIILSLVNLVGVLQNPAKAGERIAQERAQGGENRFWTKERAKRTAEWLTFLLGITYTYIYMDLTEILVEAEWTEQLYNSQVHQPIWTGGVMTVGAFFLVGVVGYLILSFKKIEKLPPLTAVLCMAGMYLGMFVCFMWCIQVFSLKYWILCVFPVNCIMIYIRMIRLKIWEWGQIGNSWNRYSDKSLLNTLNNLLCRAELWPVLALVLALPLLGILLCILVLFGQTPDAVIKAWTETAQWRLSQQIAPQNAMYDEHYLCTVAAGGHEKVVKPIRMGERHGHRVVVNRQLCIANAFEQILEERTPKFHKAVRHFYATYGFPLSRIIKTKAAADIVYILMKPLEWIFLIVIYLCDTNPENRIAVQYLP